MLYLQITASETTEVRAKLPYENIRKILAKTRLTNIPPSPETLDEFIDKMESNSYPAFYQDMYLGHAAWEQNGKFQNKRY